MYQTIPMNIESVIYDTLESSRKTINGIPAGYLSPSYPRLVGGDGKPQPVDVAMIVDHFHNVGEDTLCAYTGVAADGVNVVDGDPKNFLITNLEPISKTALNGIPFMPKGRITKVFAGLEGDIEVELYGVPLFRAARSLDELTIHPVPQDLGLAYAELELLWLWNELTKVQLLKGLTTLAKRNKQTGVFAQITNQSVLEFTFRALHFGEKE